MGKFFRSNRCADSCAKIMGAALPFITIGLLGNSTILYIAVTVGAVAFLGFLWFLVARNPLPEGMAAKLDHTVNNLIFAAYPFALSGAIMIERGLEAYEALWFALFVAALVIINGLLPDKRKG